MVKRTRVFINLTPDKEEIRLYHGRRKVGYIKFCYNGDVIEVWDLTIFKPERRKGYGTILMHTIMGIASAMKKPIYLFSYTSSVDFYHKKMRMLPLRLFEKGSFEGKEVTIDLTENEGFRTQVHDTDMIWFPDGVTKCRFNINYL